MTDVDSLREAIEQYETQLSQVQLALTTASEGHDKDNLLSLQSDIQELIALTKESLRSAEGKDTSDNEDDGLSDSQDEEDDPMGKEYAMFKAELEEEETKTKDENEQEESSSNSNSIEDELKTLEGMKCRAPHGSSWGGTGYHNAMVSSILRHNQDNITSINDIMVKVLFINPIHKEMLPCSYFLNGSCKFSDDKCHYSHGEIVPFSSLQEYREPDYSTIKMGSRVLAKEKNGIWHRSVVIKAPEKEGDYYRVKFESSGNIIELDIHDLLPLHDDQILVMSDTSDSNDSDVDYNNYQNIEKNINKEELINKSLFQLNSMEPLGKWEQHTRGMGSKLMAQMGYVLGTGLGKKSDGRIVPVEATVLPAGKSLDHCMELRENAGGDKNLFSVQKRMKKQTRKLEKRQEKQYQREKTRDRNVFDFINNTLGDIPKDNSKPSSSNSRKSLKTETTRDLNLASFRIDEDIKKLENESSKLMNSLGKCPKGSIPYNNLVIQYNDKQNKLTHLRFKLKNITAEQKDRKDKLIIF
ncbi:zinc finger CCCH-type with G patch domain-containing protein [Microplitis demolitor]|uniref:zinc finger CCCH-type with G patch domain-containing protein n=1 Tax=Microplitis demolitor TaxID=69319 RepID=UPI0004CDBB8A|nr:zinc finger CCCH-type with G patch domain-containing protein [Microplitis demolitor]